METTKSKFINFFKDKNKRELALFVVFVVVMLGIVVSIVTFIENERRQVETAFMEECTDARSNIEDKSKVNCSGFCDSNTCSGKTFCCREGMDCSKKKMCPDKSNTDILLFVPFY